MISEKLIFIYLRRSWQPGDGLLHGDRDLHGFESLEKNANLF